MILGNDWPKPEPIDNWQTHGACKDHPELTWYPSHGESQTSQEAICDECPVRVRCLLFAIDQNEVDDFGIWGGTSAKQRTKIRRRLGRTRTPAACGTNSGYYRHRDLHETICDACRAAHNAYNRELRRQTLAAQ